MNISAIIHAIAERRIELLREDMTASGREEFDKLSRAMDVLLPRVTPEMVAAMRQDVETVRGIVERNSTRSGKAAARLTELEQLQESVERLAADVVGSPLPETGTADNPHVVYDPVRGESGLRWAVPLTRKGNT